MKDWITQLKPIVKEYSEGQPLSAEDVDELVRIIKAKINFNQDNISMVEYNRILDGTAKRDAQIAFAKHYLSDDDENGNSMEELLMLIEAQADIDGSVMLDEVEGVIVWEAVTDRYTVDEFLEMIQ